VLKIRSLLILNHASIFVFFRFSYASIIIFISFILSAGCLGQSCKISLLLCWLIVNLLSYIPFIHFYRWQSWRHLWWLLRGLSIVVSIQILGISLILLLVTIGLGRLRLLCLVLLIQILILVLSISSLSCKIISLFLLQCYWLVLVKNLILLLGLWTNRVPLSLLYLSLWLDLILLRLWQVLVPLVHILKLNHLGLLLLLTLRLHLLLSLTLLLHDLLL